MKAWPDVRLSSPAMQCSRVDFPDPDGPMIAVNRLAGEVDRDPVQGADLGLLLAVDLVGVDRVGGCRWRGGLAWDE